MKDVSPSFEHIGPTLYRIVHAQWVQALLEHRYDAADFWRTQLEKLRWEVD